MIKEIELRQNYLKSNVLYSIYFGGGTPSLLENTDFIKIFQKIKEQFKISENCEITVECNPDDLSTEKLTFLKRIGVNRLSIGIQSFKEEDLLFMNRSHNRQQALDCVKEAQKLGFTNISIDLIYSLPQQSLEDWKHNLDIAFSLDIQHISSYSLTIEEKTKLAQLIKNKEIKELEDIESVKHFDLLNEECQKNKFIGYEISNYGQEGYFSKHNSNYWLAKQYLGIGPSAHSYNGKSRSWNISNNTKYIKSLEENILPSEIEILSKNQQYNDYIMTTLRTIWGIDIEFIKINFEKSTYDYLLNQIEKWVKSEDIYKKEEKVYLTTKGKYISDSICSDLFIVE
jgi:oxygen-independent coproporphyrinogen-3 oxidase